MNRRRFLGASATAGATLLAGCSGILGGGSSSGPYGSVIKWTAPSRNGVSATGTYNVSTRSASKMLEFDDDVSLQLEQRLDSSTSYAWGDVAPADLEQEIEVKTSSDAKVPYYKVFTGSFDTEKARQKLASAAEGEETTHEGFDLYPGVSASSSSFASGTKVYAVGNGAVLQSGGVLGNSGTKAQIKRVIDASKGNSDRVVDQHDGIAKAVSEMQPGATSVLQVSDPNKETDAKRGQFAGMTAGGSYGTVDGSSLEMNVVFVFENADAATSAPIDEYVKQVESQGTIESLKKSANGRVVTITGTTAATQLFSQ